MVTKVLDSNFVLLLHILTIYNNSKFKMKKRKQSKGTHEERYNRCLLFKINNAVLKLALVLRRTIKILYTKNRYKILLWIK